MPSAEDATAPAGPQTLDEETSAVVTEKTPPSVAAENDSHEADAGSPPAEGEEEEEEPEKTLDLADELFEKGSQAIKDDDFAEAVDCLSRALEIRAAHYGELAPECALSYYKYGCALLYKAQEESDPLGNVPKASQKSVPSSSSATIANGNDKASAGDSNGTAIEEDVSDKKEETTNAGSDDDAEADEEDSDLDLAWKMLDIARAIVERQPENSMDKVNIYSALAEVSLEREDFENSLGDYHKALLILENLVEPDHRRVIELNFRICLTLEVGSKVQEAIPYCEKATQLCGLRIQRLSEVVKLKKASLSSSTASGGQPSSTADDSIPEEDEIEVISGFQSDLEKKLEDLKLAVVNPPSFLSDMLKLASSTPAAGEKTLSKDAPGSESLNSSQMGVVNSHFDSPSVSTAATNSTVTHLGVIGRGVKRASTVPVAALDASSKKSPVESTASTAPGVHDSADQEDKSTVE